VVVSGLATPAEIERAYAEYGVFACLEKQAFERATFRAAVAEAIASGQADKGEIDKLTPRSARSWSCSSRALPTRKSRASW